MSITYNDVILKIGKLCIISNSDARADYTTTEITNKINDVVFGKVVPSLKKAGWKVPTNYPSTDFSTIANENKEINANILKLVSGDLLTSLPQFGSLAQAKTIEVWTWITEGEDYFKAVEQGKITYSGIQKVTANSYNAVPLIYDSEPLFTERDNLNGTTSNDEDKTLI